MVQLLLGAGADKDLLSEDNCSPLYYAVLGRDMSRSPLLISWWVAGKHFPISVLLVEAGCDVQEADLEGTSPLHGAVMVSHIAQLTLIRNP